MELVKVRSSKATEPNWQEVVPGTIEDTFKIFWKLLTQMTQIAGDSKMPAEMQIKAANSANQLMIGFSKLKEIHSIQKELEALLKRESSRFVFDLKEVENG